MQIRTLVTAIIVLAATVWAVYYRLKGGVLSWDLLQPYGTTVVVVTAAAVLFEAALWRLPLVRSYIVKRPDLSGTWRATLVSSYKRDGTHVTKPVYVVITQTLRTLSFRLYSETAHSFSLAERIRPAENDQLFELAVVYQSIPDIEQRLPEATGSIHFGALLIPNVAYRPESLKGQYWTDRRTEGTLALEERRRKRVSSYNQGHTLFSTPLPTTFFGKVQSLFA